MVKRLVLLSVVLVALLSLSCGEERGTKLVLVNSGRDPFHPNGGAKLDVGDSGGVMTLGHGSVTSITFDRMGEPWATLVVTSTYDLTEEDNHVATITVTEPTYGTFEASSSNSDITVTVNN